MAKVVKTYLFCYDDHRHFSEDVKKRFSDQSKYVVMIFHNLDDFLIRLQKEKENDSRQTWDSLQPRWGPGDSGPVRGHIEYGSWRSQ